MKRRIVLTLLTIACAMCFSLALSACDDHTLVYYEAKEATCLDGGNIAYYYCTECSDSDCPKYFSDKEAENAISADSIVISALGHDYQDGVCTRCGKTEPVEHDHVFEYIAATEAACAEDGNAAYYYCSVCGSYFSDENGETEISEKSTILSALGHDYRDGVCTRCGETDPDYHEHTLKYTAAKAAACLEDGNVANYYCSACGKYYSDRKATTELSADSITVSALGHNYDCGNCTRCGEEDPSCTFTDTTQGLKYTLSEDGTYYILTTIDVFTWQGGDIVIPESYNGKPVKAIDGWAFSSEATMTSVVIPACVEYIGESAFYGCINLEYILVRSGNQNYKSVSGNLYSADGTKLMAYALGKKDTSFTVPDGVTEIDNLVFSESLYLKNVTIPEGVETISYGMFLCCGALESVVIPASVTLVDGYAFDGCSGFSAVYYLGTVSQFAKISVVDYDFTDEDNDYFLNAAVYYYRASQPYVLGSYWYYDGDSNIALWTTAAADQYTATDGLQYTLSKDGTYYIITGYTGTAAEVYIPSSYNGVEVMEIYERAFYNADIISVTIPATVTLIGTSAFENCSSLTSVTFGENSSLTTIYGVAFKNTGLTSIVIPESVTHMGTGAFENCSSLTSVTFGENSWLTTIYGDTFKNTGLTSIVIPESVTSISDGAFENCSSLISVTFGENSSLTAIDSYAFKGCSSLESIILPATVTLIGTSAFENCYSLLAVYYFGTNSQYKKISISGGNEFFSNAVYCYSETYAGGCWRYNADGAVKLWKVTLITDSFTATEGLEYTLSADGTYYVVSKYSGTATEVYIPSSYNGLPVKKVGNFAFYGCNKITSVTFGSGIAVLGNYSFWGCNALVSVIFDDSANASELQGISGYAFYLSGTSYLTSVVLPAGVLGIGENAFYGRNSITAVYFLGTSNSGFNSIASKDDSNNLGKGKVYYYSGSSVPEGTNYTNYWHYIDGAPKVWAATEGLQYTLSNDGTYYIIKGYTGSETDVLMPDYYNGKPVQEVGLNAFRGARITSVRVGDNVMEIKDSAFQECFSLNKVVLGTDTTILGGKVFYECLKLEKIIIPESRISISGYAFGYSGTGDYPKTLVVYYGGTEEDWDTLLSGISQQSNSRLLGAVVYYYSETQPTASGSYWYYNSDGNVTTW